MKPEQLMDPETLPEDLRWVASEFRLAPKDPVFLLIAWHWHRVQQAEDSLRTAAVELQTAVDSRVDAIRGAAGAAAKLGEQIEQLRTTLERRPALISDHVEAELNAPLAKVHALEKSFDALLRQSRDLTEKSRRLQILAALLIGVALGVVSAVILLLA